MSKMPIQHSDPRSASGKACVASPAPADYSDDISDANNKALSEIEHNEFNKDEFVLVDGPAW